MVNINLNHFVFANKEVLEVEMKMKAYFLTHLLLVPDSEIAHDMSWAIQEPFVYIDSFFNWNKLCLGWDLNL